jgi:hypothetical protein
MQQRRLPRCSSNKWPMDVITQMVDYFQKVFEIYPMRTILVLAAFFRLLAVFFSPGFAMSDDHFLVIHVAHMWLKGIPVWFDRGAAAGHSIIYPGLHYLVFYLLREIGLTNPKTLMIIIRLIHAAFSMLTVLFGYKIALKLCDRKTAATGGLLLAVFWLAPFMSVRNLIEVVCIPPLVVGVYLIMLSDEKDSRVYELLSGVVIGLAFVFRYQSSIFLGGVALVLLFRKKWKTCMLYCIGIALSIFMLQGVTDWIAWGYPFASLKQYIVYNLAKRYAYVTGPWYQYLILITGVFIPPVSLYLLFGTARMWKRAAMIFWPVLLFILLHSYFPNKQERFIMPIYPFIIILGMAGWQLLVDENEWLRKFRKFIEGSWIWFWCINGLLLLIFTFNYGKKSQVEPMNFFRKQIDTKGIIIEYNRGGLPWFPRFYLGKEIPIYRLHPGKPVEQFLREVQAYQSVLPNYLFLYGNEKIKERINRIEILLHVKLSLIKIIEPGFVDALLHRMNPKHNKNLTSYIYKIKEIE